LKRIFYILLFTFFCFSGYSQTQKSAFSEQPKVVKLYPNPATSFINFEFDKRYSPNYKIVIFSFIGKKAAEVSVTDQKVTVSLTDFYRGIYIYQLIDGQGNIVASGKFQVVK